MESSFYCVPRVFSILFVKRLSAEESSVGSVFLCCALYVSNTFCEPEGTLFGILHMFGILFVKMMSSRRVFRGLVLLCFVYV